MKVVISTGAGVSQPSGIPVYRGPDGSYTNDPELEAVAGRRVTFKNIDQLWSYWGKGREFVFSCQPNQSHIAIARLYRRLLKQDGVLTIVTQNVDDLHAVAGVPSENIVELHGNLFRSRCLRSTLGGEGCDNKAPWWDISPDGSECYRCGGKARPDVVLFGERVKDFEKASGACLQCDLYIATGTSGIVFPAADLVTVAKKAGAKTVLINKDPWDYPHPDFDETIIGDVLETLVPYLDRLGN